MRLGVVGTMVWDTIYRTPASVPVAEWGGISFALAALDVALPEDWEVVPLIKVGRDLAPRANEFLRTLERRSPRARFIEVPAPNNQVTLRYTSSGRRSEQLRGGVPGWRWPELGPLVRDLDALYVNLISGFELDLETATHLRRGFTGPIYADLHSLTLAIGDDGTRRPIPLTNADEWFACFDVVQMNEDEMGLIGADPMAIAARALGAGVQLLVVTLGAEGTVYFTDRQFTFFPRSPAAHGAGGAIRTARIPAPVVDDVLDPTGCGDVFGAALVGHLLARHDTETALRLSNALAARNAQYHGATDLQSHLRGEILRR